MSSKPSTSMSFTTEPISILKNSNTNASQAKSTRIVLSDDEEDFNKKYLSDGDEDEQNIEPMSAEALELLNTEKVIKAGYLLKKGEKRRTWKKRWFVLRSTKLAMYKDNKEYKLLRIIDLLEIHKVVQVTTKNKYKNVFAIVTPKRMYYVQANDQNDMEEWFSLIKKAKDDQRLYDADDDTSSVDRDQEFAKDVITSYKSANQRRQSLHDTTHPSGSMDVSNNLNEYSVGHAYPLSPSYDQQHHQQVIEGVVSSEDDEEYMATRANIQLEESKNRVLIEGYLLKLGRNKGWRKRWFVLRTDTLAYYEDEKEYSPHRIIPLDRVIDSLEIDAISKSKQYCFKIIIPKRTYVLCASSEEDMDAWLNALIVASNRAQKDTKQAPSHITPSTPQPQANSTKNNPTRLALIPEDEAQKLPTSDSADSFENVSQISGAGGVGGAGGALGITPTSSASLAHLHLRATERLGRAK